jgi:cysteine desulfurase/selenocysteine lyase
MDPPVTHTRHYFDHAATGWPKSEAVYQAMDRQARQIGSAAGRGGYSSAVASSRVVAQCRQLACRLFHADLQGDWIIAANGSAALNMAIHGILRPGDHVVTTASEHNSVLRPLHWLKQTQNLELQVVPLDSHGRVTAEMVLQALQPHTRLVIVNHGNNVTGAVNPVEAIGDGLRSLGIAAPLYLVDAAQTAGQWPIDLRSLHAHFLAMPGHKSLGGPLGTGLLYVDAQVASQLRPIYQGGTGSQSDQLDMPLQLPDRLEVGNLNVPAIAGLTAGIEALQTIDLSELAATNSRRVQTLAKQLSQNRAVKVFCAGDLPIVSLTMPNLSPHELANILDNEFAIETRAGMHCAPLIHQSLGTAPTGTLRASFAAHTPQSSLDAFVAAIQEITA